MMDADFEIAVSFRHRIRFTRRAFLAGNEVVRELLEVREGTKVVVFIERAVAEAFRELLGEVESYLGDLLTRAVVLGGGEEAKQDRGVYERVVAVIEEDRVDRHSYVFAIGGGAFLDVVGYAAATAHRGVRLVRFPTTTLAQDDSGVGVKNGVNAFGKKNFLGTFAVPYAVVNDFHFLSGLDEKTSRGGLIEAVKVALVRDADFFEWIEANVGRLAALESEALERVVETSALLHARHIAEGGDPFESGSSRPLDYGHWSAHKMEQLSGFELSHGEAVSIGVALDSLYAGKVGMLCEEKARRVIRVIGALGLPLWDEVLELRDGGGRRRVFHGLEEFREHLGGELTVLLIEDFGVGVDCHEMDEGLLEVCLDELKQGALVS